ncbi:bifunctional diaminohydroxyphosphoribosylaminopyrimidine deaminase/5-amino-6-(5-phosphoribosylamino)uracil reductase RibD [Pedobacter sp. HMF7056]|uniref:Riboflavin biosynthesis protein RibD n=2 Tax=Hufsiella ginkgonis TaxID=2695274 RepID=A0A7K1Y055_9SPHI|nr:bifunctional diaminohydroxyphosphoribosylaminopyrimidine deaminase/5-amino-6-(5-phosphoribosylamino)uracil reductase RibD [Hufsiella ginkgonis]
MRRCIGLARLGAGKVSPNPMVGSVIVHNDRVIGEGYHQRYGGPHAEVNAVNTVLERYPNAADLLSNATIYVSLEPCAHFGKTPPCADLLIRHGIPRVVVGCRDPFDQVDGKGIEKLTAAGVKVTVGVLQEACEDLNKRFFTRVRKQRPYIILKWAQTADSFFAPADGSQRWITSAAAKRLTHRWRSEEDAILVGKNTALADDPQLNVRHWQGRNPTRIVIDRRLDLPETLRLFDQSQDTIVLNGLKTDKQGKISWLQLEDFDHYLPQLTAFQLYLLDVQSVIVEGGVKTLELFINAGLWDEARIFTGPQSWGEGTRAPSVRGTSIYSADYGPDHLQVIRNRTNL